MTANDDSPIAAMAGEVRKDEPMAFPGREYETRPYSLGMTLREWFAAHSPITMEDVQNELYGKEGVTWKQLLKRWSEMNFAYADAMMEARKS